MGSEVIRGCVTRKYRAGRLYDMFKQKTEITAGKAIGLQIGGNHYTKMAIQPIEFSMKNNLDALQHTVIKYVCRFRDKNGLEDLRKAHHAINMLIEMEYPDYVS